MRISKCNDPDIELIHSGSSNIHDAATYCKHLEGDVRLEDHPPKHTGSTSMMPTKDKDSNLQLLDSFYQGILQHLRNEVSTHLGRLANDFSFLGFRFLFAVYMCLAVSGHPPSTGRRPHSELLGKTPHGMDSTICIVLERSHTIPGVKFAATAWWMCFWSSKKRCKNSFKKLCMTINTKC